MDSLHTQNYNAHITINFRIHMFKTRSAAASMLPFPLPEVSAVRSWRPNQTPLSARSSFLLGQWLLHFTFSLSLNVIFLNRLTDQILVR